MLPKTKEEKPQEKTIYNLEINEMLVVVDQLTNDNGIKSRSMEVTRVPGGWIYTLDFPGYRQCKSIFVPFVKEVNNIINKLNKK